MMVNKLNVRYDAQQLFETICNNTAAMYKRKHNLNDHIMMQRFTKLQPAASVRNR